MSDLWFSDSDIHSLSTEAKQFGQKASRSICEIQHDVSTISDVLLFLEILGYNDDIASKNGFLNLCSLAGYVFKIIRYYEKNSTQEKEQLKKSVSSPLPTTKTRLFESFALVFPWLGSLTLLFVFGASLWMAWDLPLNVISSFLIGVFVGILATEGLVQGFTRLFTYHYEQNNLGHVKELLRNYYLLIGIIITIFSFSFLLIGEYMELPENLYFITIISMVSVSLHRASFMIIYALKKFWLLISSYSLAFVSLELIFLYMTDLLPDIVTRYFVSLMAAFTILSAFAIFSHYALFKTKTNIPQKLAHNIPHFYSNPGVIKKTIKSRFSIQLWEISPYLVLGVSYFAMIFSDRALSWLFNPHDVITATGITLPLTFNATYHAGADIGLLVLFVSMLVQYFVITNLFPKINNITLHYRITEWNKVTKLLQKEYRNLLIKTIVASSFFAIILYFFGSYVIQNFSDSQVSVDIMNVSLAGNVALSIFGINLVFVVFLNKLMSFLKIPVISSVIVLASGFYVGTYGFEYVIYSFLISSVFAAITSTLFTLKQLKNSASLIFSKYV